MIYTIVICGYEGIDSLEWSGTDPLEAKERVLELKRKAQVAENAYACLSSLESQRWREVELPLNYYGSEEAEYEELLERHGIENRYTKTDQVCVHKFDGEAYKCCCPELGVEPAEVWWMG